MTAPRTEFSLASNGTDPARRSQRGGAICGAAYAIQIDDLHPHRHDSSASSSGISAITWPDPQTAKAIAGYISLFTDVFLRLIKMIIAPLVFSTLVVGVAHMGDTKAVGRIGGKAMLWFVSASLVSLLLGLIMVNILRPGDNLNLPLPDAGASTNLNAASLSFKDFVTHLVPKSAVEAMANNEILQIVVFSLFFGVAAASLGRAGKRRRRRSSSETVAR